MGPVRQNPIHRTVKSVHMCVHCTVHNCCTQYCTEPQPHHSVLRSFFQDYPCELVPEENFWTLWCKGTLTEADTLTIWLGATLSGLTSAHLCHPPNIILHRTDLIIFPLALETYQARHDCTCCEPV